MHSNQPVSSSLRVRDFSITPIPNQLLIQPGATRFSNLTITSIGGFSGAIALSASIAPINGTTPTVTITPSSVRLRAGTNSTSTLLVSATSATAPGSYTITVVAQSQKITHNALVTVIVSPPPDFGFVLVPSFETVPVASSRSSLYTVSSLNGFSGTVTVTPSNIPINVGVGLMSQVSVSPGGSANGTVFVNVGSNAIPGTYSIIFAATNGSRSHTAILTLTISPAVVPDFSITANPVFLTIPTGSTGFVNITLSSIGGFSGNVSLTESVVPVLSGGPVALVTPPNVFLASNSIGGALLRISTSTATPAGFYNYTVAGTSGLLFHQVFGSFTVSSLTNASFTLSASPSSLSIPQGSQAVVSLNLTSIGGFSGTITLAASVAPSGPYMVFGGNTVTLASGGTAQVTMIVFTNTTVPVPFGNYKITVTGSSGSLVRSTVIPLTVTVPAEDLFLLSASFHPTNVTIQVLNTGNMAASLIQYAAQDRVGDTWERTGWSGPTIGPNSTASGILLTIGVSCPACTYSGTPGAFNQFIPGNVYTIYLVSARNILYKFSATYPSAAREGLSLQSSVFSSGTNVTLFIGNIGNVPVSLVAYYVKDSSGNQYSLTSWAGPTINPNSTSPVMILIGSSCPGCTLVGSAFTFTPGVSYTITMVTSRNNQFSFAIVR